MKVGDRVYLMVHAYHHVIGEVEAILGKKHILLGGPKPVLWVYSCKRGWTEFFQDGLGNDTDFKYLRTKADSPPVEVPDFLLAIPWLHDIPFTEDGRATSRKR